ncbi:MAG TPA: TonB-dependent receptor [Bryobacterales bacterium]|nr:TonB-dependent receptor [Bryobacterales bacterium]
MRSLTAGLFVLVLSIVPLLAQDTRARVQGIVTDTTGAVVVGASVTLLNNNTGIRANQASDTSGHYVFDLVLPGDYTVEVELTGFRTFVQKNVLVQTRGDVTVNARLDVGNTLETVTVEAAPVAVQFNTSTMAVTVDTKMTNSLPIIHRNPFLLVELNPAVVIRSTTEQNPFHHWAASQFDVGGNTNTKNDIVLDGSPSMVTQKSSYTPPMDAVQQVNLQQNSVDAEFGHSAGGVLSVEMKSGTNEFHGTAYYLGRNPVLNALADRTTRKENLTRQHVWGGTFGSPIKKNKIFNFVSYEAWRTINPLAVVDTLPTAAERTGDFSQSLNTQGNPRVIYDPWTTQVSGNTVTRQPFAGNRIPASRIDPTSKLIMGDLWQPNRPGEGSTQVNNFVTGYANRFRYWNLSDRVDYNISDKWRVFGRYNQFRTFTRSDDWTGGSAALPVDGSQRHALSFSGDAVYALNSTTVLNFRGAYNSINDSFGVPDRELKASDLQKFWPGNAWYQSYLADLPQIYYPGITVNQGSGASLGKTGYWYQVPNSFNIESKISKNIGRHYVKVGGEYRRDNTNASRPKPMSFVFNPASTANTFNSPNTALSGDGWASFLLGALDDNSTISSIPIQRPRNNFIAFFVQDDFKLSPRLTLNLGLRYEYFSPMRDPELRLSRFLDLSSPIPELQGASAPALPDAATALRSAAPIYNGAWIFTDSGHPGSWDSPKTLLMPRLGAAWRVNNDTALRVGWARYIIPATLTDGLNILGSVPYPGFDATSTAVAPLLGVPQERLSDPFPGGLVPVAGKSFGRYTNLGGSATWYEQNFTPGVNDRFNVSLQRALPRHFVADVTFFMNLSHNLPFTHDLNLVDPRIGYQVGNAVNQAVANPFYNLLPPDKFPGQLRTQQKVAVSQLLRPYPQYTSLPETLIGGADDRYKALQISVQRQFSGGFNLILGYNYNRESGQEFYDDVDSFTQTLTWQPAQNPRHRLTGASIYGLPFGKGRKYMNVTNPILDGALGGWSVSGLFTYNAGTPLRLGSALVSGDPGLSNPTSSQWFDTSKVKILPPFTRRTNPVQYDDLLGPRFVNLDMTLAKEFPIKERLKFELRLEGYNMLNAFTGDNPVLSPTSPNFGKIVQQRPGIFGRQIQYSGRFIF